MPTHLLNDEEFSNAIGPDKDALKELLPTVVEAVWGSPLQLSGENLVTVCQFDGCSDDKKPSFNIYRGKDGLFRCILYSKGDTQFPGRGTAILAEGGHRISGKRDSEFR